MILNMKALRVNAGLNQADAAAALGVSRQTLAKWENGKTSISAKRIIDIAELYKCQPADIFNAESVRKSE